MEPAMDSLASEEAPHQSIYPSDHPLNSHWIVKLGWLERLSEDWNVWWPQASERFAVPFCPGDFEEEDIDKVPRVIWDVEQASACLNLFNGRMHSAYPTQVVLAFVAATLWAPQGEEAPLEGVEVALCALEQKHPQFIEAFIKIRRHFTLQPSPHLFMKPLWDTLGGPGCLDRMMPAYPARWPTLSRGVPTAQSLEKAERPPLTPDVDDWKRELKAVLTKSPYDIDEFVALIQRYPGSEVDGFVLSALYSMVHDWGWTDNHSEFQEAVTHLTERLGRRFFVPLIRIRFHFNLMEGMNRYTRELSGSPYLRRIDERLLVDLTPGSTTPPPPIQALPPLKRSPPSSLAPAAQYRRTPSTSSMLAPPSPAPTTARLRGRSPSPSRSTRRNSSPTRPEPQPTLPHVKPTSQVPQLTSTSTSTRRPFGHQRVHSSGSSAASSIKSQAPAKEVPARIPSPARPPAHTHGQPRTHFPGYTTPTYSYTRGLSHKG